MISRAVGSPEIRNGSRKKTKLEIQAQAVIVPEVAAINKHTKNDETDGNGVTKQQQQDTERNESPDAAASSSGIAPEGNTNEDIEKNWRATITPELRNHLVNKLISTIFPNPNQVALLDDRLKNLVNYAEKVEREKYKLAKSRSEYYHLLAEKIYRIQKELDGRRRSRRQMMQQLQQQQPLQQDQQPEPRVLPSPMFSPESSTTSMSEEPDEVEAKKSK